MNKNANQSRFCAKEDIKQGCHSQGFLLGIFRILSSYVKRGKSLFINSAYVEDPRYRLSGMTVNKIGFTLRPSSPRSVSVRGIGAASALYPALQTCGMTKRRARGFTLIELLVVVLIIGILAAVAVPQYRLAVEKSRANTALLTLRQAAEAMEMYYLSNGKYPDTLAKLDIELPTVKQFRWIKYSNTYIALIHESEPQLRLAYGLRGGSDPFAGRYSCDIYVNEENKNLLGAQLCRTLCQVENLEQIWGSSQPGCVIRKEN